MGNCAFNIKTGKCDAKTPGNTRKCDDHKGLKCHICGGVAWRECPDVGCGVVVCSKPECMSTHIEDVHGGNVIKPEGGDKLNRKSGPKGEDVTLQTSICPFCEPTPTRRKLVKTWNRHDSKTNGKLCQVVCLGCGMCGPSVTSRELAIQYWGELPTKELAPYEIIRVTALRIIEREMKALDELSLNESLSNETQIAMSRMAEVAASIVDLWGI